MTKADLNAQSPGVQQIMLRPYHRVVRGDPIDGYFAEVPEWPGCWTAAETPEKALESIEEAMRLWLESNLDRGLTIPDPAGALTPVPA